MILFEDAYQKVLQSEIPEIKTELAEIFFVNGRILAEDIISDIDMPPFDKSSMDGFACRREDVHNVLQLIEIISAGKTPEKKVGQNQCSKIMTGAMIPEGADFVVPVENSTNSGDGKIRCNNIPKRNNISYRGEDIRLGDKVLEEGMLLKPQHIAVLATAGYSKVKVAKKIKVAVISTGDELVEPNEKPGSSQIRNSNAYQLCTQLQNMGAEPDYIGIAKDNKTDTNEKLKIAFNTCDVVLLTGGVSMGDFDFIPEVLKELGVETVFHSVAIQPGKPTMFGKRNKQYCYGLPGNPVSSFVIFELLVKPLIYKMMGHAYKPVAIKAPIAVEYTRKKADRMSWIPVLINSLGQVEPVNYHGSAHINSFSLAHGIISIPINKKIIEKGEIVDVRQI